MNVRSILDTKGTVVETIGTSANLGRAVQLLRDRGIGALVVSDDGTTIAGIVSERDVVSAVASHGASALGRTVASVMTIGVVTCSPVDPVEHLMELMTDRRIRHVPVVDDQGRMIGIVSIGDVVKSRVSELKLENEALTDYVRHGR